MQQLSDRLYAVAQLTNGADKLADVGCDHGYIPIYLLEQKKITHAIAMDINKGPLLRAKENIDRHGLGDSIEVRLSDGVAALKADEADTVVIAGMGGGLTIHILEEGKEVLKTVKTLVLQPQSEIGSVRRYLQNNGYSIEAEDMIKEEGKYYPMMRVCRKKQELWDDMYLEYGRFLIENKNAVLQEFLEKEEVTYTSIAESLKERTGERIKLRKQEVLKALELVRAAKESMS